jgi:hypothetical protein
MQGVVGSNPEIPKGGLWEGEENGGNVRAIYRVLWGGLQHAARRAEERRGMAEKRTGRDEGEKAGKGTDSKGYAGERRQRLSDPNPGSAGYSASISYNYTNFILKFYCTDRGVMIIV